MGLKAWRRSVKNNYSIAQETVVIDNIEDVVEDSENVLSANSTVSLMTTIQTTINAQIATMQAEITALNTTIYNLQNAP